MRRGRGVVHRSVPMGTIFEASSFDELSRAQSRDVAFQPGDPFIVELSLNQPVGHFFDASGVEAAFRARTPPGMELVDVSSPSSRTVIVEFVVRDVAQLSQGRSAHMGIVPAAVLAFIAAHWVAISIVTVVGVLALTALVSAIRGKAPLTAIRETVGGIVGISKALPWILIGLIALQVLKEFRR